jgi:hypothetical protein
MQTKLAETLSKLHENLAQFLSQIILETPFSVTLQLDHSYKPYDLVSMLLHKEMCTLNQK